MSGANCHIGLLIPNEKVPDLFDEASLAQLATLGDSRWISPGQDPGEFLRKAEIAVGSWGTVRPSEELLAVCPSLRLWIHAAGTVKAHFGPHLKNRDLQIVSCSAAIAGSVAEYTLGLIIAGLYQLPVHMKAHWAGQPHVKPRTGRRRLFDATVGVVGASQVGRQVIKLLRPLARRILLYDPYCSEEEAASLGAEKMEGLLELCGSSQVVTMHTPDLPATRQMMGGAEFEVMADDAVLINTSRGVCIDQAALEVELRKGRLLAFLDVTSPEPLPPDYPHRDLSNLVVTPHLAGGPSRKIGQQVLAAIEAYQNDQPIPGLVTESMLTQLA